MARRRDRILRVDLTAETVTSETVPEPWRRAYIGGKGLGARYLYEDLEPGVDPLGPENVLVFGLGPLSGYLPGETRYVAVTKSPLTGTFLDSYAGGSFPASLAGALEDHLALLVTGRAHEPVRIEIEAGDATIEPASTWGADTVETCRAHEDPVACIGPAGEHQVAFATIASDEGEHHAGRGGAGAVMGAKRLKAVLARGDPPEGLEDRRERAKERYLETPTGRWQGASGTLETVDFADETDVLAARGWTERGFDGADGVGVEAVKAAANEREHEGAVPGGFRLESAEGETVPRGGTAMTLGAGLGLEDFDDVAALGERCNRLGLDFISGGNAVALAIRAAEAGVFSGDRFDADVSFGDGDAAADLLAAIATRSTDLGDVLAGGVDAAAETFDAEGLIPTVKDMALPAYDPRGTESMALAYATSDRGACHRRARPVEREALSGPWSRAAVVEAVLEAQDVRSLRWSLVADDFVGEAIDVADTAEWLEAVGAPVGDLAATGERIWNLVRLFNVREGFDRADDELPAALDLNQAESLTQARFEATLDAYYEARGWSDRGIPTRSTLARLDLLDVIDADTPVAER